MQFVSGTEEEGNRIAEGCNRKAVAGQSRSFVVFRSELDAKNQHWANHIDL